MSEILIQPIQSTYSIIIGELGQKNNIGVQQIVSTVEIPITQMNGLNGQTPIPNDDGTWHIGGESTGKPCILKDVESVIDLTLIYNIAKL